MSSTNSASVTPPPSSSNRVPAGCSSRAKLSAKGEIWLGRSALAARAPCVDAFPRPAPSCLARGGREPLVASPPDPLWYRSGPARRTRERQLRHAMLQTIPSLLLPEIGRQRTSGQSGLGRLLELPVQLQTDACGAGNRSPEFGLLEDRVQPGDSCFARAHGARLRARELWCRLRALRTPTSRHLA